MQYLILIITQNAEHWSDETQFTQAIENEKMFSKLIEDLEQLAATKEMLMKVPSWNFLEAYSCPTLKTKPILISGGASL